MQIHRYRETPRFNSAPPEENSPGLASHDHLNSDTSLLNEYGLSSIDRGDLELSGLFNILRFKPQDGYISIIGDKSLLFPFIANISKLSQSRNIDEEAMLNIAMAVYNTVQDPDKELLRFVYLVALKELINCKQKPSVQIFENILALVASQLPDKPEPGKDPWCSLKNFMQEHKGDITDSDLFREYSSDARFGELAIKGQTMLSSKTPSKSIKYPSPSKSWLSEKNLQGLKSKILDSLVSAMPDPSPCGPIEAIVEGFQKSNKSNVLLGFHWNSKEEYQNALFADQVKLIKALIASGIKHIVIDSKVDDKIRFQLKETLKAIGDREIKVIDSDINPPLLQKSSGEVKTACITYSSQVDNFKDTELRKKYFTVHSQLACAEGGQKWQDFLGRNPSLADYAAIALLLKKSNGREFFCRESFGLNFDTKSFALHIPKVPKGLIEGRFTCDGIDDFTSRDGTLVTYVISGEDDGDSACDVEPCSPSPSFVISPKEQFGRVLVGAGTQFITAI